MAKEFILLGAGKLGTHLARALQDHELKLSWVYNRTLQSAEKLAQALGAKATDNLQELPAIDGIYLFAVADAAIVEVAEELSACLGPDIRVAHTSGATPYSVFQGLFKEYGVFYPLQSFSKEIEPNFNIIPLCICASSKAFEEELLGLAETLSQHVFQLSDKQRGQLHLAGVFANNFVNVLLGVAYELLEKADIPKEILWPIIQETILKVENEDPQKAQTGPAVREDEGTMERHLQALTDNPDLAAIYQALSALIIKRKKT